MDQSSRCYTPKWPNYSSTLIVWPSGYGHGTHWPCASGIWEWGGREFEPWSGHWLRYGGTSCWSNQATGTVFSSKFSFLSIFIIYLGYCPRGETLDYRRSAPFLYEVATSHVKIVGLPFRPFIIIIFDLFLSSLQPDPRLALEGVIVRVCISFYA